MQKVRFSIMVLLALGLLVSCSSSSTTEPSGNNALSVGGKVTNASFANGVLTFSPSTQFFTARFYQGEVAFADVSGTKWQTRTVAASIPDNTTQSDGINDWKSPFDLSVVTSLQQGTRYTMLLFFTSDLTNDSDQGIIVFTR